MLEDAATTDPRSDGASSRRAAFEYATLADKARFEAESPLETLYPFETTLDLLADAAARRGDAKAVSFQLTSKPTASVSSLSYNELYADVMRAANGLAALGVAPGQTVALILPNLPETVIATFAGHAVGAVNPINPMLEPAIMAHILDEAEAVAVITLAPFPKVEVAERAAEAVALSSSVKTIVEIDLGRYLPTPTRLAARAMRPKRVTGHGAAVVDFHKMMKGQPADRLTFARAMTPDTVGAYFHTGGTTGAPKLAQHDHRGMVFNGWMTNRLLFSDADTFLCALPLFHVFGAYAVTLCSIAAGAHMVLVTPSGFRGEGVIQNFWKLVERHRATFFSAVPTAISMLDQQPIDADVSSLRYMISGSAPLPEALFRRFEQDTGLKILEGYGMTEATCVTSCNPPHGERRVGSVGLPLPHVHVAIVAFGEHGPRRCAPEEIGEICFAGPSVFPGYKDPARNAGLFVDLDGDGRRWLRTGDLGRLDAEGYVWITGRAKDLIIRGGHNIDPGLIEEALAKHPAVAFVGAIGQPDARAGEMPCAYVELKIGASATPDELRAFAAEHVSERAARPAVVTILDELPKTAVGKIFKPSLRHEALRRVYGGALRDAGIEAEVSVQEDKSTGMTAVIAPPEDADRDMIAAKLNDFPVPWRLR